MIFDTFQYVDGSGVTQEVALKLSNVSTAGGATRMVFIPRSHAASELQLTWALAPEFGKNIPFKSRCIVRLSRTSTDGSPNSFSVGTILFQGRRADRSGSVSSKSVSQTIVLKDAWWDLEKVSFVANWRFISGGTLASPTYTNFAWPDVVLFQATPGVSYTPAAVNGTINSFQQVSAIINYAAGYASGTDAVQLQIGGTAEYQPAYVNWYPVRSAKCAEALNICLRPHPGVFTEIDYTTTPPTIHFRNRAALTAVTLPYAVTDANGVIHVASDIQSLDELVPDNVRLFYKINGTYNGQPVINYSSDNYPDSANHLLSLDFSIDITGASQSQTVVNFTSTAFDPTSKALWRLRVPGLRQVVEGGQIPNDGSAGALAFVSTAAYNSSSNPKGIQVIDDTGAVIDYSSGHYEFITDQDVMSWMTLSSGAAVGAIKATVKAFFSYDKVSPMGAGSVRDKVQEHEHHFRVLLTNAPTGQYVLKQTLNAGESIPANLAQYIYTELADLQWKLRHEIFQVAADTTSVPTLIKPGKHKINLSGGASSWTAINAVAQNVSIELFRTGDGKLAAKQTIRCGPVNHLEPGYLVQLANLFCNRNRSGIDPNQRSSGTTSSTQVDLSASATRENSTAATPVFAKQNVAAPDVLDATRNMLIVQDAASGQISVVQQKASDGSTLTTGVVGAQYTGAGAPAAGTLVSGTYYRGGDRYFDTTNNLEYLCADAGTNATSAWLPLSWPGNPNITAIGTTGVMKFNYPGGPTTPPLQLDPASCVGSDANIHPVALREFKVMVTLAGVCKQRTIINVCSLPFQAPDDPT